jgi:hypothetical protein
MLWAFRTRLEPGMCVSRYRYRERRDGQVAVRVDRFSAANTMYADSTTLHWRDTLCGDTLPSWHGHIVENGVRWGPSFTDLCTAAARVRVKVPFHLVSGDTGQVTLYRGQDAPWPTCHL